MERLKGSLIVLSVLVFAIAAFAHLTPPPSRMGVNEEMLEKVTPDQMDGRRYVDSYTMDEKTYKVLNASGIVCRVFEVDGDTYDTVLISSRRKDSFHDPNICFSAQGFTIDRRTQYTVDTKLRGKVPVMILSLTDSNRRKLLAAYTYKGPDAFYANTNALKVSFLKEVMVLGNRLDGVFYRFIPRFSDAELSDDDQKQKLLTYISEFLDACEESNKANKLEIL